MRDVLVTVLTVTTWTAAGLLLVSFAVGLLRVLNDKNDRPFLLACHALMIITVTGMVTLAAMGDPA